MNIITDKNNIILEICSTVASFQDGVLAVLEGGMNVIYPDKNEINIFTIDTVSSDIVPGQHCYDETNGFYDNPDYKPPMEELLQEQIDTLSLEILKLKGLA